jgi:alkanesulfonate monooxygenase SsuD/methylene tetrahydromethanopterin reductase-like flavin-dependent oxidoreductase (luciferase family)
MPRVPAADDVGEFGQTVESLGYNSLWLNESWGFETFVELTAVACQRVHPDASGVSDGRGFAGAGL